MTIAIGEFRNSAPRAKPPSMPSNWNRARSPIADALHVHLAADRRAEQRHDDEYATVATPSSRAATTFAAITRQRAGHERERRQRGALRPLAGHRQDAEHRQQHRRQQAVGEESPKSLGVAGEDEHDHRDAGRERARSTISSQNPARVSTILRSSTRSAAADEAGAGGAPAATAVLGAAVSSAVIGAGLLAECR